MNISTKRQCQQAVFERDGIQEHLLQKDRATIHDIQRLAELETAIQCYEKHAIKTDYELAVDRGLIEIKAELMRAKTLFPDHFHNQHEAYAVIKEEFEELWDEFKKNQKNYDLDAQRKESVQLGAMTLRLIVELLS